MSNQALLKYFGGKAFLAPNYPRPVSDTIVEPFAGGLGYSIYWRAQNVVATEKDPVVFAIWDYLINYPKAAEEISIVPDSLVHPNVMHPKDIPVAEPLRDLVSFWVQRGSSHRKHIIAQSNIDFMRENPTSQTMWGPHIKARLLKSLPMIRNWKVYHASWEDIDRHVPNQDDAMWFCDPPYQNNRDKDALGDHYTHKAKRIDFKALGDWCKSKKHIIVCESTEADWLDFVPLKKHYSQEGETYTEAIWEQGTSPAMLAEEEVQ